MEHTRPASILQHGWRGRTLTRSRRPERPCHEHRLWGCAVRTSSGLCQECCTAYLLPDPPLFARKAPAGRWLSEAPASAPGGQPVPNPPSATDLALPDNGNHPVGYQPGGELVPHRLPHSRTAVRNPGDSFRSYCPSHVHAGHQVVYEQGLTVGKTPRVPGRAPTSIPCPVLTLGTRLNAETLFSGYSRPTRPPDAQRERTQIRQLVSHLHRRTLGSSDSRPYSAHTNWSGTISRCVRPPARRGRDTVMDQ
jgi:hypothetical protein